MGLLTDSNGQYKKAQKHKMYILVTGAIIIGGILALGIGLFAFHQERFANTATSSYRF